MFCGVRSVFVLVLLSTTLSFSFLVRPCISLSRRSGARASLEMMQSTVRVTTYNVLSDKLAPPQHFTSCKPEYLEPTYRMAQLQSKLEEEVRCEAVIALQEVSANWAGQLHVFFAARNYQFVTARYGKSFNGYMGVAVAWPANVYEPTDVEMTRISDTKPFWPAPPAPTLLQKFWNMITSCGVESFKQGDEWSEAQRRFNEAIFVRLRSRPRVMTIHVALVAQYVQVRAGGDAYVLMGDFNIKPVDSMYKLLTEGSIEPNDNAYPISRSGDTWSPLLSQTFRSAYKVANGVEPDFTNYAKVKDFTPFIDTLDYIFLSHEWLVHDVAPLPHRTEVNGPFPGQSEPSDHLLLAANLALP